MERQSTSKLYRALIAVVAFFVLCTSAILFASCGTDPRECKHEHLDDSDVVAVQLATCGTRGTVTYECSDCGAEVTVIGTLATGEHKADANGKCTVCGLDVASDGVTLNDVKKLLAEVASKVDKQQSAIIEALTEKNFTIPALDAKLEEILESVRGLGNLEIEGFDPSDFEDILADTIADKESATLAEVITALYKQVHRLYTDYASTSADSLYKLLVGSKNGAHVHNWVLKLIDKTKGCNDTQAYKWVCAFCGDEKPDAQNVVVQAVGHVTDFKFALTYDGADKDEHYLPATCISGARVEGHCVNCGQWTGEWNEVGKPTYQHHYVLEEDRKTPSAGSACVVSQKVYHCETCGGAYVEEAKGLGHQYYYKMVNGKKDALSEDEKRDIIEDYWKADTDAKYNALTEEQKGLALQPYLNIVYSADATCVDPGLVVVECVECGVRYSYTTGVLEGGHNFTVVMGTAASCTTDGTATYAYCDQCGYFFQYKGTTKPTITDADFAAHSRDYMRKSNNDVIYLDPASVKDASGAVVASKITASTSSTGALKDVYGVITAALPAEGHHYVPVYTNTVKCVTSQTYILVCDKCFNGGAGTDHTFGSLLYPVNATNGVYALKGLTGNNVADLAANGVKATQLNAVAAKVKADDPSATVKSDLTQDWDAAVAGGLDTLAQFFVDHDGYLNRDAKDDEKFETDETKLLAQLKALGVDGLKALYKTCNAYADKAISAYSFAATEKVNPVTGHTFSDKFVTVVGGCTMYERHVYFCDVCGTQTLTDGTGAGPSTVVGDTDDYVAGSAALNDLQKDWEATCAVNDESGNALIIWLLKYGYLNDYRPSAFASNDWSKIDPKLGEDGLPVDAEGKPTAYYYELTYVSQMMRGGGIMTAAIDPELVEIFEGWYTKSNVLGEYKVENKWVGEYNATAPWRSTLHIEPITLGHTFDTVVFADGGETCDEPASYVYVCSKCGLKSGTTSTTFGFYHGAEQVKFEYGTGSAKKASVKKAEKTDVTFKSDAGVFTASVPAARLAPVAPATTAEFVKSDLELDWDKQTTDDAKFTWLLNHGYLNGVIDSLMLYGYGEGDDHVVGALEDLADKSITGTDQSLQAKFNSVYGQFYDTDATTGARTLKSDKETDVKTAATAIAKAASYFKQSSTTDVDLGKFYTQSGDNAVAVGSDVITGKAANKTTDKAATKIPESGHVWVTAKDVMFNPDSDPRCKDFAIEGLTNSLNPESDSTINGGKHYFPKWVAKSGNVEAHWEADTTKEIPSKLWDETSSGVLAQFLENASNYGIVAYCQRGADCPLHSSNEGATAQFAFGFYAATDHQTSYEKYSASSYGYPTGKVETKTVYYNYKTEEDYRNELANDATLAKTYLTKAGSTATTWAAETDTAKQEKAVVAYMNDDLLNLGTLQKIWNSLFVDLNWLYTTDTTVPTAEKEARIANYPLYEDVMNSTGEGTAKKYTGVNFEKVENLFKNGTGLVPGNTVPQLWKSGRVEGEIVSAWRPLGDNIVDGRQAPSCWVSLRCKWYKYDGGNLCTKGYPDVNHINPVVPAGAVWYDVASHLANCQHKDLCMTCGQEIGKTGNHNLTVVPDDITDAHLREAWIEILKAAKASTATTGFLKEVKDAVWFAEDVELSVANWSTSWGLKDQCADATNYTISICTGELEVIYNNLHPATGDPVAWNTGIADSDWEANKNYKVTSYAASAPGHAQHSWANGESLITYHYNSNYFVNGEKVASKDAEIWLDANGNPAPAGSEGATKVTSVDQLKFSPVICSIGYYMRQFCTTVLTHKIGDKEAGSVCGAENTAYKTAHTYEAIGHTYAPVKGYQGLTGMYEVAHDGHNAVVSQVCTNCGLYTNGEWGLNGATGSSTGIFNLAGETDVANWNTFAEKWNADHPNETPLWLAQMIDSADVAATNTPAGTLAAADGLYVIKATDPVTTGVTVNLDATTAGNNKISAGKDVTFLVGKDGLLNFAAAGTTDELKTLTVEGTLSIVGEGVTHGSSDNTSRVDFSALKTIDVKGQLVFKDILVDLGVSTDSSCRIETSNGGTISFTNCDVVTKTTPFSMLCQDADAKQPVVVSIKNSYFLSVGDVALGIWKSNVTVEAENSLFTGSWAGALVRGGTGKFTNCWFATDPSKVYDAQTKWQTGTDVPVNAAVIVGNDVTDNQGYETTYKNYGTASATLTKCVFYTYSTDPTDIVTAWVNAQEEVAATADPAKNFSNTCHAIAAYASEETKTALTLDAATVTAAGKSIDLHDHVIEAEEEGDEDVHQLTYTIPTPSVNDLGTTDALRATAAGALVESVLASGGTITLPKITNAISVPSSAFAVAAGKATTVNLGNNALTLTDTTDNGATVAGDVTISGGKLTGKDWGTAAAQHQGYADFRVSGKLTLDGITGTMTDGGIKVISGGTVTIKGSHLFTETMLVSTNNQEQGARKIVIDNSTILATDPDAIGVVVNKEDVTLEAKSSTFFGAATAVWVRAGVAKFENCTFVSGGWRPGNTTFGSGTQMKKEAYAALAVGEGSDTSYGHATVTITGEQTEVIRGWNKSPDATKYASSTNTVTWTADGVLTAAESTATAVSNKFSVSSNTSMTNVTFGSKTVADKFTAQTVKVNAATAYNVVGLVKDQNVFYPETGSKIKVQYVSGGTTTQLEYTDVKVNHPVSGSDATARATSAKAALADAAKSGGKVELPKQATAETVDYTENLVVAEGKSVELVLNGNTVKLSNTEHSTSVEGSLEISGGTVSVPNVTATQENENPAGISVKGTLTLKNVTVLAESGLYTPDDGKLVIEDSFIWSNDSAAISTNNLYTNKASITIKNSTVASTDQTNGVGKGNGGNVALLVNKSTVTVTAVNSTFYGVVKGVWVRAGKATFDGCTFISGSAELGEDDVWASGTTCAKNAIATLLVGDANNGGTNYGNADVTLTNGCKYVVSHEVVSKSTDEKYVVAEGNLVTVDATAANSAKIKATTWTPTQEGTFTAKAIVLAAHNATTTSLTVDGVSATNFGITTTSFVLTKNALVGGTSENSISVKIGTGTVFHPAQAPATTQP